MKIFLLSLILIILAFITLSFFTRLPDISDKNVSHAISSAEVTILGQALEPLLQQYPAQSGVYLLLVAWMPLSRVQSWHARPSAALMFNITCSTRTRLAGY